MFPATKIIISFLFYSFRLLLLSHLMHVRVLLYDRTNIPLEKRTVRLGACKFGLSPPVIYITDRFNAILLLWFYLFYNLVLTHCAVCK